MVFPRNELLWLQDMYSFDNSSCTDQVLDHTYLFNETIALDVDQSFCKAISNHLFILKHRITGFYGMQPHHRCNGIGYRYAWSWNKRLGCVSMLLTLNCHLSEE